MKVTIKFYSRFRSDPIHITCTEYTYDKRQQFLASAMHFRAAHDCTEADLCFALGRALSDMSMGSECFSTINRDYALEIERGHAMNWVNVPA